MYNYNVPTSGPTYPPSHCYRWSQSQRVCHPIVSQTNDKRKLAHITSRQATHTQTDTIPTATATSACVVAVTTLIFPTFHARLCEAPYNAMYMYTYILHYMYMYTAHTAAAYAQHF